MGVRDAGEGEGLAMCEECRRQKQSWWVIQENALIWALRRAAAGESPDMILLELSANSEHSTIEGE